jgi:ketosteroid isomerase-like protein
MPTLDQIKTAFENHFRFWNARDREAWIGLFDENVTFDDPVGVPTKHGLEAAARQWDASFTPGQVWKIYPGLAYFRGNEAASVVRNVGDVGDEHFEFETIEIWGVGEDGKIVTVRGYYDPPPAVDAYFRGPEDRG